MGCTVGYNKRLDKTDFVLTCLHNLSVVRGFRHVNSADKPLHYVRPDIQAF